MENTAPIKHSELTESHLKKHPVWTWYEGSLFDAEDTISPVELTQSGLAAASIIFVYSRFRTADDQELNGTITYDVANDEVFSVELILGNERFGFNKSLPSLARMSMNELRSALRNESARVFPLTYSVLTRPVQE